MKKVKVFLTATAAIAIVGGAFAFNTARKAAPNVFYCNATTNACALPATAYSTSPSGSVVTPPFTPYVGSLGGACGTPNCHTTTAKIYINE